MQNFTKVERLSPKKSPALERLTGFGEIYALFDGDKAASQAERCVQCGNPYCSTNGCPLHNYIPYWLKAIAEKDRRAAFRLSNENSPFPEILGRICPQDRLCEGACTLGADNFGAISVGAIETAITEGEFERGLTIDYPKTRSKKRVALIGSGPASLSAATFLARAGLATEIFEKDEKAGGLLTYGIPNFKLDKKIVDRRFGFLAKAGVKIHLGTEAGKDITFNDLLADFDAAFIGVGARRSVKAEIENESANGVIDAIDFLSAAQIELFDFAKKSPYNAKNKNVVVIGGGDTAMDCVRTALRLGAKSATCVYRRAERDMPGAKKEFINAKEEGAEFIFNLAPSKIVVKNGAAIGATFEETKITEGDGGRGKLIIVKGSERLIDADMIIMALGFAHHDKSWLNGVKLAENGAILVDEYGRTNIEKIYAGGDATRGASLAVNAAADGKKAALSIIRALLAV
ncbi:MAG: glutamate synthase subunit beta [Helicobacteraceae bacterium]|jgi:glutamate synthase (NADPH/NADH) small chain|nr:glutamate synthase subunit beta [Helicobacteraceae bacterium]